MDDALIKLLKRRKSRAVKQAVSSSNINLSNPKDGLTLLMVAAEGNAYIPNNGARRYDASR